MKGRQIFFASPRACLRPQASPRSIQRGLGKVGGRQTPDSSATQHVHHREGQIPVVTRSHRSQSSGRRRSWSAHRTGGGRTGLLGKPAQRPWCKDRAEEVANASWGQRQNSMVPFDVFLQCRARAPHLWHGAIAVASFRSEAAHGCPCMLRSASGVSCSDLRVKRPFKRIMMLRIAGKSLRRQPAC